MNDEQSPVVRFPELQLEFVESRILGCLLEKETTTPAYYPMTANSLEAAANQSSNRYPVTKLSSDDIAQGIQRLRDKELIIHVHVSGSRVPKYEHLLPGILELTSAENAVVTVLLLRGVQTAGEIKLRTERLHPFSTVEQVEEILQGFIEYPNGPLVKELPAGGGRRVKTYAHLLGGETELQASETAVPNLQSTTEGSQSDWQTEANTRLGALEFAVEKILNEIGNLKEELGLTSED
jgi:uncharacterized protein YceH (UPF0502 family)